MTGGAKSTIRMTLYRKHSSTAMGQKGNRNEIANKHIVGIYFAFLPDGSRSRRFVPFISAPGNLQLDINTASRST